MDQTTHHLLTVLAEFYEDRVMHDVYGIEDDSDAPLEIALRNWSAAGFPDTVASSARIAEVEQERDGEGWVFTADLRRAIEGKRAVGNHPLVLDVQVLRRECDDARALGCLMIEDLTPT